MRTAQQYRDVRSWERSVQAGLSPMHVIPHAPVRVTYRVSTTAPLRVGEISASPGKVVRASGITPDPQIAFLGIQRSGEAEMREDGRTTLLRPGWASFYRHGTRIEYEYPVPFQRMVVRIPVAAIGIAQHDLDVIEGQPLRLDSTVGKVLEQALCAVVDSPSRRLDGPLAALLGAFVDENLAPDLRSDRSAPVSRIVDVIRDNALDGTITLPAIAGALHLSARQVQRILGAHGTSYQDELLSARLDHAARLLRRDNGLPVIDVATRSGFSSPSHFSRSFRDRFGMAPGAWRREHR